MIFISYFYCLSFLLKIKFALYRFANRIDQAENVKLLL